MKIRLRSLVVVAGSIAVAGAAWPVLTAQARPTLTGITAEPPASGHDEHAAEPKDSKPAAKESKQSAKHDEDAAHEDAHDQPEAADDHHDEHDQPAAKKPAKATKPADTGPRKPLFGDKNSDKKAPQATSDVEEGITAERAIELLTEGNQRWATGDSRNPSIDSERRKSTADKGQQPFVTVLTCADSRIPVERVFDRGVGEIFTVRVAGNVAAVAETGTIEYGVEHLHTSLLVVMGHTKCGAVAAAASGQPLHGNVGQLVASITPAVERVKKAMPTADEPALAAASVKENVWQSIFDLYRNSDELRDMARDGKLKVVGAIYDIATGKVEWLGEHPWQSQILDALQIKTATAPAEHE